MAGHVRGDGAGDPGKRGAEGEKTGAEKGAHRPGSFEPDVLSQIRFSVLYFIAVLAALLALKHFFDF